MYVNGYYFILCNQTKFVYYFAVELSSVSKLVFDLFIEKDIILVLL